jgi:hypothetical protein
LSGHSSAQPDSNLPDHSVMLDLYITLLVILASIVVFFIKYAHTGKALRLLGAFLLITFAAESYANYLLYHEIRNLYIYHLLVPVQYSLLAVIYAYAIENTIMKKVILISVPLFIATSALFASTIQPLTAYNSYAASIKNILLTVWVLCYYRELFVLLHVSHIEREPFFWISTGILFYSLGDFFVEGLMNYLISHNRALAEKMYYVYFLLNLLLYFTFMMAFLCKDIFSKKIR